MVDLEPIADVPKHILDSIWRQFGAHSTDHLGKLVRKHPPYLDALSSGLGAEIAFEAMVDFYGTQSLSRRRAGAVSAKDVPSAEKVLRPKVMRNHSGKPVSVNRWMPKRVD